MTNIGIDVGITFGLIVFLAIIMLCLAISNVRTDKNNRQKTTAIKGLFITMILVLVAGSFAIIFI